MALRNAGKWSLYLLLWLTGAGSLFGQASTLSTSGVVFTNYSYQTESGDNAFSVNRAYVTVRGALSPGARFRVTSDVRPPDSTGGGYDLILKYAYAAWSPGRVSTFTFGLMNTGAFLIQERTWGLRYLFKTALDQYHYAISADFGLGYQARFLSKMSVMAKVTNGGGFTAAETNTGKRLHLRLLYGSEDLSREIGFNAGVYGSVDYTGPGDQVYLYSVFVGRHSNHFWVGSEFGTRSPDLAFSSEAHNYFYSFYGRLEVSRTIQLFGRTDYDQDALGSGAAEPVAQRWHLAGVQFSMSQGLKVTPNIVYHTTDQENTLFIRLSGEIRF